MTPHKLSPHHYRMDELIDGARETLHEMIDQALESGAIPEEMANPQEYRLAKAVITIWGDQHHFAPPDSAKSDTVERIARALGSIRW